MIWKFGSRVLGFGVFAFLVSIEVMGQSAGAEAGQRVQLSPGWNLMVVQVEPSNSAPAASFAVDGVVSVWTYDASIGRWRVWLHSQSEPSLANVPGLGIERIQLGGAYWVQTSRTGVAVTIDGRKSETAEAIELTAGWNLLGVPVVGPGADVELERISMISVLARAGAKYDRILKWENDLLPGADARRARSYNQIDPNAETEDFRYFDPERGYWVRVTEPGILQPRLLLTLRSDIDRPPKNNFPSPEDLNITYHGIENPPEGASVTPIADQRRIVFLKGEEVMTLGLSNVGGGILLWEVESNDDWLEIATEAKGPSQQRLNGVTTVESETIFLRLNAGKVGQGSFESKLQLRTSLSADPIVFRVSAEAPSIEGEWKGSATIESVNGKRNRVPDIDLFLSIFEDPKIDKMFRAVIDSSNTLMWPVDVSLAGYLTDSNDSQFSLSGGFILPPGDVNNEPFEEFPGENDADWNQNGEFEDLNPLPFPIQRTVSLEGAVVAGDPVNGFRIEGNYTEIVHGMLSDAIELRGKFSLVRNSLKPFSAYQPGEAMIESYSPVFIGRDQFPSLIPAGRTASSNSISVPRDYVLHQIQVTAQFTNPLPHTDFSVHLVGPPENGGEKRRLILYQPDPKAVLEPSRFQNVIFPDSRPFLGNVESFMANLTRVQGDWHMEVTNSGGIAVGVSAWSLRLVGQPVGEIAVNVLGANGEAVNNVSVNLSGLPYTQTVDSGVLGERRLLRVPAMPVAINASRLTSEGFQAVDGIPEVPFANVEGLGAYAQELRSRFRNLPGALPAFHGVEGYSGGSVENPIQIIAPAVNDVAALVASPGFVGHDGKTYVYGRAPLNVELRAVGVNSVDVVWRADLHEAFAGQDLGNLTDQAGKVAVDYLVEQPSVRTVSLFVGGQLVDSVEVIAVNELYSLGAGGGSLPHPDPAGNGNATAALRADNPVAPELAFQDLNNNGVRDDGEPVLAPQAVEFLMLQHMYAASADIDLAPYTDQRASFSTSSTYGGRFNGDGLSALEVPFSRQESNNAETDSNNAGFAGEDHDYTLPPGTWISVVNNRDQAAARGYTAADGTYDSPAKAVAATMDDGVDYQFYRMACRLGATVAAAMPSPGAIAPAERVSLTPLELDASGDPVARNIGYRVDLNPFARQARSPGENER